MKSNAQSFGQLPATPSELTAAVYAVADNPSNSTRDGFYRAVARNRVGARIPPGILANLPSGNYVTTADWQLKLPMAHLPSGEPMLVMLTDIPLLRQFEPATTFVEFDGIEVLRIAMNKVMGVIVQVDAPQRKAWAGVSIEDVEALWRCEQ